MSMRSRKHASRRPLTGMVEVPGDKSISHRALLLSALAGEASTIRGLNDGDDVRRTAAAVSALGARVTAEERSALVQVEGWGRRGPFEPSGVIDAGNSGTTARVLLGVLSSLDGTSMLTGDASLSQRPMLRVVAPLRAMGAAIDGREHGDRLPLSVRGGDLEGMDHMVSVASAQVKSALLLAGLRAGGSTSVTEPRPSRDHTENMLRVAGVEVVSDELLTRVRGGQDVSGQEWSVPGDVSSAMFLIVAAALVEGSDISIAGVGLNPRRIRAFDVLTRMGASIDVEETGLACGEPVGNVRVRASRLQATTVRADEIPSVIDEIPVLAIAASQAEGESVFEEVGELRAKESDRLSAVVDGLEHLGGTARVEGDALIVQGPTPLTGGAIDPRQDHRIAMSFAVAGLLASSTVKVSGWSCVDTSFPTFLEVLGKAQGAK
jgi:3-phosphoshikimate 1-carboxyvinyltransferase